MTLPVILPMLVPMDVCVPANDRLTSKAGPFLGDLTGAFGGFLMPIGIAVTVVVAIIALLKVLSRDGKEYFKLLPWPFIIMIAVAGVIMLGTAIWNMINNSC